LAFRIEDCGNRIAASIPNYHDNLPLAALVPSKAAITAMCFDGGLHILTEIPAIDLSAAVLTTAPLVTPISAEGVPLAA
jgi:hypothetical protein